FALRRPNTPDAPAVVAADQTPAPPRPPAPPTPPPSALRLVPVPLEVPPPPPPAADEVLPARPPSVPPEPAPFKRRQPLTAEELRRQLLEAPAAGADAATVMGIFMARERTDVSHHPTLAVLDARTDLGRLPLLRGPDCRISKEAANALQGLSRHLRQTMAALTDPRGSDPHI